MHELQQRSVQAEEPSSNFAAIRVGACLLYSSSVLPKKRGSNLQLLRQGVIGFTPAIEHKSYG